VPIRQKGKDATTNNMPQKSNFHSKALPSINRN